VSDNFDPFAGETGLKANYEGEIIDAYFAAANFGLRLELKVRDIATGEEDDKFYGCGPDWGSYDGGETAEHPKGDKKGFNNNTAIFELIAAAFEAGAEEELRRRSKEQFDGKGPKAAGIWKGLRFYWEARTTKKQIPDEDNPGKRKEIEVTRILPTKYLGVGDSTVTSEHAGVSPAQNQANVNAGGVSGSEGNSSFDLSSMGLPDDQLVQIKVKAKTSSYGDWVDAVMALPGALENGTLMSAIGDESFYNQLKEG
jgi:hypothetical protein